MTAEELQGLHIGDRVYGTQRNYRHASKAYDGPLRIYTIVGWKGHTPVAVSGPHEFAQEVDESWHLLSHAIYNNARLNTAGDLSEL